ncbi:poly(ADP-ribose) glycohydrolase 1-like isoform X1 [Senna tora]|uniref:poly(ADP-ribose) glycohydrolase n=1 Tax=Senna tora TaxID=362788 RepID=A0A834X252_9FABA|nr:poly(ADP-ribose) glycohydrolase 1-like isoform X1 [Senna tora]
MRSSSLFWPSQVVEALRDLEKGPLHSGVDSGELLFLAISDIRNSLGLSTQPLAPSVSQGYAFFFDEEMHAWALPLLLMSGVKSSKWFEEVIPALANLLLRLPSLLEAHYQNADMIVDGEGGVVRTGLRLLDSQEAGIVFLTQKLLSFIVVDSVAAIFIDNREPNREQKEVMIRSLYDDYSEKQENKIWCIIHYFERISSDVPKGIVSFERKVLPLDGNHLGISYPNANFWSTSVIPLCRFEIHNSGLIEDQSNEAVEVDFANKFLGGGALRRGCVQEEIRFMISPELIAGMLFLPSMADNEAVEIVGVERYASSFRFSGDYVDRRDADTLGRRKTRIVAIDALCSPGMRQYREKLLLREINKAFCGFLSVSKHHCLKPLRETSSSSELFDDVASTSTGESKGKSTDQVSVNFPKNCLMEQQDNIGVATGNWGCGAFGGDPEVKTIIQWLAASQALRPFISYYTFGMEALQNLDQVVDWISSHGWTVGDLWNMLVEYSTSRSNGDTHVGFFKWLLPSLYDHYS